jgi:hypothetical protein
VVIHASSCIRLPETFDIYIAEVHTIAINNTVVFCVMSMLVAEYLNVVMTFIHNIIVWLRYWHTTPLLFMGT